MLSNVLDSVTDTVVLTLHSVPPPDPMLSVLTIPQFPPVPSSEEQEVSSQVVQQMHFTDLCHVDYFLAQSHIITHNFLLHVVTEA